jgi:hypothetical protein
MIQLDMEHLAKEALTPNNFMIDEITMLGSLGFHYAGMPFGYPVFVRFMGTSAPYEYPSDVEMEYIHFKNKEWSFKNNSFPTIEELMVFIREQNAKIQSIAP